MPTNLYRGRQPERADRPTVVGEPAPREGRAERADRASAGSEAHMASVGGSRSPPTLADEHASREGRAEEVDRPTVGNEVHTGRPSGLRSPPLRRQWEEWCPGRDLNPDELPHT